LLGSLHGRTRAGADFLVDDRGQARPAGWRALHAGKLKAGAAVLALGLAAPAGDLHSGVRSAGAAAWTEVAALIQSRSPGLRRAADYLKGKRAAPVVRARPRVTPRRAVISSRPPAVLTAPPPAPVPLALADTPLLPGPADYAALAAPVPPIGYADFTPVFVPNLPGIKEFTFLGGGPGGTVPPPTGGPPPIGPPPPAPIPEPGSWATMIAGFAMLGWMWRRRRVLLRLLTYVPLPRLAYLPARGA
jgi:hypothetical protein